MFDKIKGTINLIKGLDKDTLEGIRWTLIFILVLDVGLFYWFMNWKKFGIALMLVLCVMLAIIMILERRFPMEEKTEKKEEDKKEEPKEVKEEKKEEKEEGMFNVDLGLGSSEEYNERLKKALG